MIWKKKIRLFEKIIEFDLWDKKAMELPRPVTSAEIADQWLLRTRLHPGSVFSQTLIFVPY